MWSSISNARQATQGAHSRMLAVLGNGEKLESGGTTFDEHREDLKRDMIEGACSKLEGQTNLALIALMQFLLACLLTLGAAFSPMEILEMVLDPCPRLFLILAGVFVVCEAHFLVKHKRDASVLPKLDRSYEVTPEYFFLTGMDPEEWYTEFGPHDTHAHPPMTNTSALMQVDSSAAGVKEAAKRTMDVTGTFPAGEFPLGKFPLDFTVEARKKINIEDKTQWYVPCDSIDFVKNLHICPGLPITEKARRVFSETSLTFYVSIFSIIFAIIFMFMGDTHPHAVMFYGLTSTFLLSSSITLFLIARDRMAARIWRYHVQDAAACNKGRTGDHLATFVLTNILRSLKSVDISGVFQVIRFVSLATTLWALPWKEHWEHQMAGFYLVLASIGFVIVAGLFLTDFYYAKSDKVDTHIDEELGMDGSLVPIYITFLGSLGVCFWGVLIMNWGITEKMAVVMGVLVFCDATFHHSKFEKRSSEANSLGKKWKQRFGGEHHMQLHLALL